MRSGILPEKVESAERATEIAHSFVMKHKPFAWPIKAIREGDVWLVEIDVGPLLTRIAKFKIDANTGEIMEYTFPTSSLQS